MTADKHKISDLDALAILVLGGVARFGGPLAATFLQLLAMLAGVVGVLSILWSKIWLTAALFAAGWACWWLGERVHDLARAKPLDQVAAAGIEETVDKTSNGG